MSIADKPNILFILSDDQGEWAMGCSGNSEIFTPNIGRLANVGTRFSNFFCASPVCSPARASILTGRIPSQHGVHDWLRSGNINRAALPPELRDDRRFSDENKPIEYLEGQLAYTEILAENGYTCALSGKWHLGDSARPQKGFSKWSVIARGGAPYYGADVMNGDRVETVEGYLTDYITDNAIDFLDQLSGEAPFYLGVHYTAPHTPWGRDQHPKEFFDLYEGCSFDSVPVAPPHPWQVSTCPQGTGEERKELLRGYYAAITAMDRGIGRILDRLDELGLTDNTLIVFTGDNGMNCGQHGIWGKGNGTFPQNMFDTSVKVPMIMSHRGKIAQARVCGELLSHYDIFPTLLDYLGIDFDFGGLSLPGESFAEIILDPGKQRPREIVVYDEYGPVRMIRGSKYKYVHRYPYGPHEFYDVQSDPGELRDLIHSPECADIIAEMRSRLEQWFYRYADPAVTGVHEAVTGNGQLGLPGIKNGGRSPYHTGVSEDNAVRK